MMDLLREWLERMAWVMDVPEMFGVFHLCAFVLCVLGALLYGRLARNARTKVFFYTGIVLCVMEVYKQLFVFFVINHAGFYDWWYFPFQLCSMPMYLCIVQRFVNEKTRTEIRVFLGTYGVIAALAALIYPQDMLRKYVVLTVHGFLYHGVILGIGAASLSRHNQNIPFTGALGLFLVLCLSAEAVNTIGHHLRTAGSAPDMFYISPYLPASQPVFSFIGHTLGRCPEICIYIIILSAASWVLYTVRKKGV